VYTPRFSGRNSGLTEAFTYPAHKKRMTAWNRNVLRKWEASYKADEFGMGGILKGVRRLPSRWALDTECRDALSSQILRDTMVRLLAEQCVTGWVVNMLGWWGIIVSPVGESKLEVMVNDALEVIVNE